MQKFNFTTVNNGDSVSFPRTQQSEGLPNIKAKTYPVNNTGAIGIFSESIEGAFYHDPETKAPSVQENSRYAVAPWGLALDASKGECKADGTYKADSDYHVYGASEHVTPQNSGVQIWERIA